MTQVVDEVFRFKCQGSPKLKIANTKPKRGRPGFRTTKLMQYQREAKSED